jgi:methionyl-tRNA synthetase
VGDGDFSERRFKELYNADLANGLGNLISRIAKLASTAQNLDIPSIQPYSVYLKVNPNYQKYIEEYQFNEALAYVWGRIKTLDITVSNKKPWEKNGEELTKILNLFIVPIQEICSLLQPFLPATAKKILDQFKGPTIKSRPPLFPRIS